MFLLLPLLLVAPPLVFLLMLPIPLPVLHLLGALLVFLGKAHSAMMKMFTFHCSQHHDVVTRMVTSKNTLKARLRDSGVYEVSDDERLPTEPPSDFGFPSGPEWADFFDEAGGSGAHDDDEEDAL